MKLPKITDIDVSGKKVIVRLDLDTEANPDDLRIKSSEETLDYLKEKNCQITIIGHKGRPGWEIDKQSLASQSPGESLSLKPFQLIFDKWGAKVEENLRFDPREEENDDNFTKELASLGDVFVNEAFADSHRAHASIVGIPKFLPHAAGFHFVKEVENLSKVIENPARPVVVLVGGIKKDKLDYIEGLVGISDRVLVGGRLPEYIEEKDFGEKVLVANLMQDKEDLTLNSIDKFKGEIAKAKTIVLSGPMGKYEEEGHRQGTKEIFEAVVASSAFKIAGGGDTEEAINTLGLQDKFDWISVGGGAMLDFLVRGTLPGIEALLR